MFAEFLIEVQKQFAYKLLYLHINNLLFRHITRGAIQKFKTFFLYSRRQFGIQLSFNVYVGVLLL